MDKKLTINSKRLFSHITKLGEIGRLPGGGITRLALTNEDMRARELVKTYMQEAGLSVTQDSAGNIIGRLEGQNKDMPVIMTGSHIDTVLDGGAFDGALGVLGAIEALQTMKEQGIKPDHPIEAVIFTDEEGTRFNLNFVGSRAVAGTFKEEYLDYKDAQNITLREAMQKAGLQLEKIHSAQKQNVKCFLELHIEQAKVLEENNLPAGIVTGIAGPLWLKFTLNGQAGHAGATPMHMRKDPLPVALDIIQYIFSQVAENDGVVGTVGRIEAFPGGINIIPERVEFTLDLRDIDEQTIDKIQKNIYSYVEKSNSQNKVQTQVQVTQKVAPVKCSEEIINKSKVVFEELALQPFQLMSGAGHDGMNFKELCPIGMIFVRSQKGLSHHREEWTTEEDCAIGTEILYRTLLSLDKS